MRWDELFVEDQNGDPCKVLLIVDTETGETRLETRRASTAVVPTRVYNGLDVEFELSPYLPADRVEKWVRSSEVRSLVGRIVAGTTVEWDGINRTARRTYDAECALDSLSCEAESLPERMECFDVVHGTTWLLDWNDPRMSADTTDDEIEALAEEIKYDAHDDGVLVLGVKEALEERRRGLRGIKAMGGL